MPVPTASRHPGLLHPLQVEWDADLVGGDPLSWPGYAAALDGLPRGDSVITGRAAVDAAHVGGAHFGGARRPGRYVVIAGRVEVMGGSMGAVHGERVVRAYRRATLERLPVVVIAATGGARLQEGLVALAQLVRTSAAARAHAAAGLLSVGVFRPPTMGGVLASYGSLTDLRAAEPGATIGLAGPRVVEVVTGDLPGPHAHTAESAYEACLVDALVAADQQAGWVETVLGLRDRPLPGRPLPAASPAGPDAPAGGAWPGVLRARARSRATGIDHAARLCESWVELRGPDPAVRAGLASIGSRPVVVVAHDRHAGRGRPGAAGFRLARRAIDLADHLGIPLVTFVDTPGADPSPAAETAGIAGEIALTFAALGDAGVPTVAVCVGEGGGGGALALAACDTLLVLEHSIFEIVGPEAAAAILARDASQAARFADRLRLSAADLVALGVADAAIPETDPGVIDAAIVDALDHAVVGNRLRRLDALTARWLR